MNVYIPLSVPEEIEKLRKRILTALRSDCDENAADQILTDYIESVLAVNGLA